MADIRTCLIHPGELIYAVYRPLSTAVYGTLSLSSVNTMRSLKEIRQLVLGSENKAHGLSWVGQGSCHMSFTKLGNVGKTERTTRDLFLQCIKEF